MRKSAFHGCASRFVYGTLDPPCKRSTFVHAKNLLQLPLSSCSTPKKEKA